MNGLWKIIVAYGVTSFAIIQLADIAFEALSLPEFAMQLLLSLIIFALPLALIISKIFSSNSFNAAPNLDEEAVEPLSHALAILPLTCMSGDKEIEHFSDALSDQLISACQNNLDISVRSRNSTFVYKDQAVSIRDASRELNCSLILEGSVQSDNDKIRVIAQLIDANSDTHLWASNFDRDKTNSFDLQDDIAAAISADLKIHIASVQKEVSSDNLHEDKNESADKPSKNGYPLVLGATILTITLLIVSTVNFSFGNGDTYNSSFLILFGGALVALLLITSIFYSYKKKQSSHLLVTEAEREIQEHISKGRFFEAFVKAAQFQKELSKVKPDKFWDEFSLEAEIKTADPDYNISWRPYNGRNIAWRNIPNHRDLVRLPKGNIHFKVSKDGYQTQEFIRSNPSMLSGNFTLDSTTVTAEILHDAALISLSPVKEKESETVNVSRGPIWLSLVGMNIPEPIYVDSFEIDQKPVTNAEYKKFVDEGGYTNKLFWESLELPEGLSIEKLLDTFTDRTQNRGPSTWELGKPRDNELNMPVTGICWYEAAAYANFANKSLPTVYQWIRAALPFDIGMTEIPVSMMKYSNFQRSGPNEFGEFQSPCAHGTYDMFGNVREWVFNKSGQDQINLGGSYMDQAYTAMHVNAESGLARTALHGFRCVVGERHDKEQLEPISQLTRDYTDATPVNDQVFDALVSQFRPRNSNLQIEPETLLTHLNETKTFKESISTGYGERMNVLTVLPEKHDGSSLPTLIYFPGLGDLMGTNSAEESLEGAWEILGFFVSKCNCALIAPSFSGVYERFDYGAVPPRENYRQIRMDRIRKWVQETHQVVSYLKESTMPVGDKIGWLGLSYGAINTMPVLALTEALEGAILMSGNLPNFYESAFADAINYLPRIKMPVLLLNGKYDTIVSSEQALLDKRMEFLGTSPKEKTQIIYEAGHVQFPKHLVEEDVFAWLSDNFSIKKG